MIMPDADVIVVGAGPAGSSAARDYLDRLFDHPALRQGLRGAEPLGFIRV
ncbi:MAG: hypothetical protein HY660_07705 [Armatimonadetes bacterium]|nr:hypothetical protein [Armatimonadota bacterium]